MRTPPWPAAAAVSDTVVVMCPRCGGRMMLSHTEPAADATGDDASFSCRRCRHVLQHRISAAEPAAAPPAPAGAWFRDTMQTLHDAAATADAGIGADAALRDQAPWPRHVPAAAAQVVRARAHLASLQQRLAGTHTAIARAEAALRESARLLGGMPALERAAKKPAMDDAAGGRCCDGAG